MKSGRSKPNLTLNWKPDVENTMHRHRDISPTNSPSGFEVSASIANRMDSQPLFIKAPLNSSTFTFQSPEHEIQPGAPTYDIEPFDYQQMDSVACKALFGPIFANSNNPSVRNSVFTSKQVFDVSFNVSPRAEAKFHVKPTAVELPQGGPVSGIKYVTSKNKRLDRLFDSLMRVFLEESDPICKKSLKPIEQILLVRIVKRKFARDDWNRVSPILVEFAEDIQKIRTPRITEIKRKEERTKFIYKYVLKKLKTQYDRLNNVDSELNEPFYKAYFGELAQKKGYPLHHFFDPSNRKVETYLDASQYRFKTINNEFLNLVFSSDLFRTHFLAYLQSPDFLGDYEQKLAKKIHKLLTRWNKSAGCKDADKIEKEADEYFISSKRCKLPWTTFEVVNARDHFLVNYFKIGSG